MNKYKYISKGLDDTFNIGSRVILTSRQSRTDLPGVIIGYTKIRNELQYIVGLDFAFEVKAGRTSLYIGTLPVHPDNLITEKEFKEWKD